MRQVLGIRYELELALASGELAEKVLQQLQDEYSAWSHLGLDVYCHPESCELLSELLDGANCLPLSPNLKDVEFVFLLKGGIEPEREEIRVHTLLVEDDI